MMESISRLQALLQPYPWAWTGVVAIALLLLAWAANWITKRVLLRGLKRLLRKTSLVDAASDSEVNLRVIPRLANVVPALVVAAGAALVPGLPAKAVEVVHALCQAFIVLTLALSVARALDLANSVYERRPDAQDRPIKGFLQVAKIVVFVLAAISIVATLIGARFLHILTGLGAMTAVTMLIFQDTILSVVASVQISSDGRVRMGDWIEMPSQNADGDVVDIALHTITVKNWDKTVTRVPTRYLISESFKNWRGMVETGARRIKRSLYIDQRTVRFLQPADIERLRRIGLLRDYLEGKDEELDAWNARLEGRGEDPVNQRRQTNLGVFRAYVQHYLEGHPGIHHGMTTLVRQMDPTDHGLPLQLWCFTSDVRWRPYEDVQSDIFDHLLAILPEFGLGVFQSSSDAPLEVSLVDRRRRPAAAEAARDA
jgi:miniconductance mechanosensitive channel